MRAQIRTARRDSIAAGLRARQAHLAAFPEIAVTVEDHQVAVSIYFSDPDGNPYEITTYEITTYEVE